MTSKTSTGKHRLIQEMIFSACRDLGYKSIQEYRGNGWRADVCIPELRIAFEIQLSPQSLNRTLKRQEKYILSGYQGCWLFENPVPKLNEERPDLPLFYVEEFESEWLVNLGTRRKLNLRDFFKNYITNRIKFKNVAITKKIQNVGLVFYKMQCWKCHEMNYLYYVETPFYSACNAKIKPEEALWESNSLEYRPEIVELARKFLESQNLKLGEIKKRYSNTIENSYTSFGCCKCDSIFGDWYIMEAKIDIMYGPKEITYEGEIELKDEISIPIKHWCFPGEDKYCS